ncbi:MAG: UDP-N-acetylmuramoyl-tripeptide--D-alanyl-D-alanine ligase, partial [Myxococcota bacterium]
AKGASALLVSKVPKGLPQGDYDIIRVKDVLTALGDLGRAHRRRWNGPVFALTGSNGKTTTKEMAAAILGVSRSVLKTEGNLNNLIGVPMTLLGLEPHHTAAIVEMGMNRLGEIARYTEIAEPNAGVVLNVGPAHIGELGSIQNIAQAKGELYHGLPSHAMHVVNADDPLVLMVAKAAQRTNRRTRTFGRAPHTDVCIVADEPLADGGQRMRLRIDGQEVDVRLPLPGAHNAQNAAAAVALVTAHPDIDVALEDIATGLEGVQVVGGRMRSVNVGPYLVVDDSYNANSASMQAAIETLARAAAQQKSRLVAVLGEMRELGEFSESEHRRVGHVLARQGIAVLASFGPQARALSEAATEGGITTARHENEDPDALFAWLTAQLQDGDLILVKGSRGIRMEQFIDRLKGQVG